MAQAITRQPSGRSPFGELLLRLRTERGLTQEKLAHATRGDRISSRSITNYERSGKTPQDWVLPHRPALLLLAHAMDLDMVDQHMLVVAWNNSRTLKEARPVAETASTFITAGREDALSIVMESWNDALNGTPQVVLLEGIAGIGKTALTRHCSDLIAQSTDEVMISWGGASSWASDIEPYLPIRSAIDRMILPPDSSTTLPGDYPSRPVLSQPEISRIIESIPLLAGAIISERALRSITSTYGEKYRESIESALATRSSTETIGRQEEYCRLLIHLAKSWPIVIVLEDLHWSGDQTSKLLLHVAQQLENLRDTPILFICSYRNDDLHFGEDPQYHPFNRVLDSISHSPQVSKLTLNEAMSPTAGMAFVRGVVEHTPISTLADANQLANFLYEQTSGHPLLTDEMKRHLLETGALSQSQDGSWEFDSSKIPTQTPSAISTFVTQRLRRVSRRARRILEIASVMDDIIIPEIIDETLDIDEGDIHEIIDRELVETHQLLLPGNPVRVLQRSYATYRFPHALFREHIYNGLPSARRKRLHLAIAEAMEAQYTDADSTALSEITSHFIQAEEWHSAQIAGYRLAQHAAYKLDWDLARVWFTQAEHLAVQAQDPQQLWRTRAARLAMLRGTGMYEDAVELGERILELADVHNWPNTLALTYHHLGEVYYDLGRIDQAVDYLERAIQLHTQESSLDLAAAGKAMLSHANYRQGKYDVARRHAQEAMDLSRQLQNSWVQPEAVLAAANCDIDLGFYQKAIENYQVATELALMVGKLQNQFIPAMNIGLSYTFMGNHDKAIEHLISLLEKMESLRINRLTAPARLYLGFAQEGVGNLKEAAETYKRTTEIRREKVPSPTLFDSVAGEMRIALATGRLDAAKAWMDEITAHIDQNGLEGIEYPLIVLVSVARAKAFFGDRDAYRSYIENAYALLIKRADLLEDPASRDSYLTNVPISVEVLTLHADLKTPARKR